MQSLEGQPHHVSKASMPSAHLLGFRGTMVIEPKEVVQPVFPSLSSIPSHWPSTSPSRSAPPTPVSSLRVSVLPKPKTTLVEKPVVSQEAIQQSTQRTEESTAGPSYASGHVPGYGTTLLEARGLLNGEQTTIQYRHPGVIPISPYLEVKPRLFEVKHPRNITDRELYFEPRSRTAHSPSQPGPPTTRGSTRSGTTKPTAAIHYAQSPEGSSMAMSVNPVWNKKVAVEERSLCERSDCSHYDKTECSPTTMEHSFP